MRNPLRALSKLSTFPKSVVEELREGVGFPRGLVDGAQDLLPHLWGEVASTARLCHHLVGQLFCGRGDDLVVGESPCSQDVSYWLWSVFPDDSLGGWFRVFVIASCSRHLCRILYLRGV